MIRSLCLALVAASPAAADTFSLPAGCEAYVTVQSRNCTVAHHFTCEGDPEGYQRRVDLGEEGMLYVGMIDAETQWIQSFHVGTQHSEALRAGPADPASFTELLETGEDSYDFHTDSEEVGATRYVGRDGLTGEVRVIDGIALRETEYSIVAYGADGEELWRSYGNEYISEDWRMFLSGRGTTVVPGETWESDDSPVEFIFPGEPGFLSANPKYDCGATLSKWEVPQ